MEYSRRILLYRRNTIESEGLDSFENVLIGQYQGKVKYHSGTVRKFSQNGNITELAQDITIIIPRRIALTTLEEIKNTGFITVDGNSYLVNRYVISDILNTVQLTCRKGEI